MEKGPRRSAPIRSPASSRTSRPGRSRCSTASGPSYCTTSACSSGAHAIGEATEWIRRGKCTSWSPAAPRRRHPVGIGGFEAMLRALASATTTRSTRAARSTRGATASSAARGAASSSSSRSRARRSAAPDLRRGHRLRRLERRLPPHAAGPNGEGAQRSMKMALEGREGRARRHRLRQRARHLDAGGRHRRVRGHRRRLRRHATDKKLWVSSTKSMMGHLLGAAGAVESAVCALAIAEGKVPPTINLVDQDPEVPARLRRRNTRASGASEHALNNSFGFGGTNCSLVSLPLRGLTCKRRGPSAGASSESAAVRCPFCSHLESKVIDSRLSTRGT
jgi:3-oxoacyl-[acyl-carrier-protein] synthase II